MCNGKKIDCFPVRGAFWENRGSAYRSQPSKGFEGVLTSPLLKSFHPSKRATSSHIQGHLTCHSHPTTARPHCCKAAVRVMLRSMGNVQSRSPQITHTRSEQYTLGTLTSQHFLHVFIISETPLHGFHPVTNLEKESVALSAIEGLWVSSLSQAHLDSTCVGNIYCIQKQITV